MNQLLRIISFNCSAYCNKNTGYEKRYSGKGSRGSRGTIELHVKSMIRLSPIADDRVASLYRETLDKMGVEISISKSLISFSGAAEFAKKFRCRNLTVDLSPVSIRNLLNSHHLPGALSLFEYLFNSAILDSGAVAWSRLQSFISSDSQHVGALSALACCLG